MQRITRTKKVLRSESYPLEKTTVAGLLDAIRAAFADRSGKIERLTYARGTPSLTVERLVPPAEGSVESSEFVTPFQMVRQHADIGIHESTGDPLADLAGAVQQLATDGYRLSMFVCTDKDRLTQWLGHRLRAGQVWQVPVFEDPELDLDGVFAVGSTRGRFLKDVEAAVFCKMGE